MTKIPIHGLFAKLGVGELELNNEGDKKLFVKELKKIRDQLVEERQEDEVNIKKKGKAMEVRYTGKDGTVHTVALNEVVLYRICSRKQNQMVLQKWQTLKLMRFTKLNKMINNY